MRSKTLSLKIPYPLYERLEKRRVALGYGSLHEMLVNGLRTSLLLQPNHYFSRWLADQPRTVQDWIDDLVHALPIETPPGRPDLTPLIYAALVHARISLGQAKDAAEALATAPEAVRQFFLRDHRAAVEEFAPMSRLW